MLKVARYLVEWVSNPARMRGRAALPTLVNFPITDNCNARCVMCDVWKTRSHGEISPDDIGKLFGDRLFAKVRHVGISGGEPTLRSDLVACIEALVHALPRMRTLSITTHGFQFRRWEEFLPAIARICRSAGVALRLNLSLDGVGDVHNQIRNIPGAFDRTMRTLDICRRETVDVQLQSTISTGNVYHVGQLAHYARRAKVELTYRQATVIERLDNRKTMDSVNLQPAQRSFFADFLRSPLLREITRSPARRLFYRELAHQTLTGDARRAPCHFQNEGVVVDAHGNLYHCSISTESFGNALTQSAHALYFSPQSARLRRHLLAQVCPGCLHDQSGAWSPAALLAQTLRETKVGRAANRAATLTRFAGRLSSVALHEVTARTPRRSPRCAPGAEAAKRAVAIGAYGGEHVGDAAILGGVVLRLHEQFDLQRIVVLSTRPDRTRRWCDDLELPVTIDVQPYDAVNTAQAIAQAGRLIYAGGPIMDMPPLLAAHLRTVQRAKAAGLSFHVEGVGIGPFNSPVSRRLAARMLRHADTIVVRSTGAAQAAGLLGSSPVAIERDPAFDYLESRAVLSRVGPAEQAMIARMMHQSAGITRVGVNLRPMWRKYAGGSQARADRAYHELLDRLAQSMIHYAQQTSTPVRFIVFPMNADQYGFSDLTASYDLADRLGDRVDWRLCEVELGVDGALSLLRQMNAVIAMRFHAAIFSLSQSIPTLGIDYDLGGNGKVERLFVERGMADRVVRMDRLTPQWLVQNLAPIGKLQHA